MVYKRSVILSQTTRSSSITRTRGSRKSALFGDFIGNVLSCSIRQAAGRRAIWRFAKKHSSEQIAKRACWTSHRARPEVGEGQRTDKSKQKSRQCPFSGKEDESRHASKVSR